MKIVYKRGDLLTCEEPWILHGCNAQGVYNAGVAKVIRTKYPSAYLVYKVSKYRDGMQLGKVTYAEQDDGKTIFNGITQKSYGNDGKKYVSYKAIEDVLWCVDQHAAAEDKIGIHVAMPMIGAGLGGGDWDVIEALVEETSYNFQPVVYVR